MQLGIFVNNAIPLESLEDAIRLGNLGIQVMLKSKKAFERLEFQSADPVLKDVYFAKFRFRDDSARRYYAKTIRRRDITDSPLLVDIMRQYMSKGKSPLDDSPYG